MSTVVTSDTEPPIVVTPFDRVSARIMFWLGLVYLTIVAAFIHRAMGVNVSDAELRFYSNSLLILLPFFIIEAIVGMVRHSPTVSWGKALGRVLLVTLLPPMRISWVNPVTNQIWLPGMGWNRPGKELLRQLDRIFGVPMLAFAFLILPVLVLELTMAKKVSQYPAFGIALGLSVAVIWFAFAVEFIIKVSASPKTLIYLKERWLDLAIVALPMFEFLLSQLQWTPLARLLRLTRVIGPQQLGKMSRMYRLRGLLIKGYQALMLFGFVARLTGNTPEKRLRKIQSQIEALKEQLAELREQEAETMQEIDDADAELAPIGLPPEPR